MTTYFYVYIEIKVHIQYIIHTCCMCVMPCNCVCVFAASLGAQSMPYVNTTYHQRPLQTHQSPLQMCQPLLTQQFTSHQPPPVPQLVGGANHHGDRGGGFISSDGATSQPVSHCTLHIHCTLHTLCMFFTTLWLSSSGSLAPLTSLVFCKSLSNISCTPYSMFVWCRLALK